jgi:hypothetical protein
MLRHFPTRDNVIAEIGKFLNEICTDDHDARQFVAAVVNRNSEWPGPAAIRDIKTELAERRFQDKRPAEGCGRCCDGLLLVFEVIAPGEQNGQVVYPGESENSWECESKIREALQQRFPGHSIYTMTAFCTCAYGQWRREMDKRNR